MGAKVTFNELTKIITIDQAPVGGEVDIDVKIDLYSDGKEDWVATESLRKFRFPIRAVGGDALPGSKALGSTFFLASDWKVKPYEGNHRLLVNGNFYSEDGTSPFTQTTGTYNVFLEQQVSSLVDSTVQQLAEIEYASFAGGVTIDTINGYPGTGELSDGRIIGTPRAPSDNWADTLTIANTRGFDTIFVIGDGTLDDTQNYDNFLFIGQSEKLTTLTLPTGASLSNCEFQFATVTGTLDGGSTLRRCIIETLNFVNGELDQCTIEGTVTLGGSEEALFLECKSGVPGAATPVIDLGGSGQALAVRGWIGGLELRNRTGTDAISVDMNSGQVIIASTCSAGDIIIRGIYDKLTDNSTGTCNVIAEGPSALIALIHKLAKNRMITNPTTGVMTVYDDDDSTVLYQGNLWEDAGATQAYRGQGAERRDRLT